MTSNYSNITLLVDMDDTIENLIPAWVEWLNNKHGTNVKPDDVTDWNMQKFYPELSVDEVYAPLYVDEFWTTIEPKQDAIFYLSKINDMGFNLYICTNSNYKTIRCKLEHIIDQYFPFISWNQIINIAHKQLINADILVDDGIHNLVGGSYRKILMTAYHNRDYDAHSNGMVRVHNWKDAFNKIIEYSDQILKSKHGEQLNADY